MKNNLIISIPVFNESERILNFLSEILSSFKDVDNCTINIINDCSQDDTLKKLNVFIKSLNSNIKIYVENNSINLGHGRSVFEGLLLGLNACQLLTVDGDHMVSGEDLYRFYLNGCKSSASIIVGTRKNGDPPLFRKVTSWIVKLIVFVKTRRLIRDCNSPIRLYKNQLLKSFLNSSLQNKLTPNILFTIQMVRDRIKFEEINVSLRNQGPIHLGTTWKNKYKQLPSLKFIIFIYRSFFEVIKF
jgi:glycosyltransferase involved in cell wall biosynthesis